MKIINYFIISIFVIGLILIRVFEDQLFYDPFLSFFKHSNAPIPTPKYDFGTLFFHHLYRFLLNLICSTFIIHFLFLNKKQTKQSIFLYFLLFTPSFLLYLYSIENHLSLGNLFTFYLRRFVIQPVPLLILIPIYYLIHKKTNKF